MFSKQYVCSNPGRRCESSVNVLTALSLSSSSRVSRVCGSDLADGAVEAQDQPSNSGHRSTQHPGDRNRTRPEQRLGSMRCCSASMLLRGDRSAMHGIEFEVLSGDKGVMPLGHNAETPCGGGDERGVLVHRRTPTTRTSNHHPSGSDPTVRPRSASTSRLSAFHRTK